MERSLPKPNVPKTRWIKTGIVLLCTLCIATAVIFAVLYYRNQAVPGYVYITTTGEKFHNRECPHIKDRTNVVRLKTEQAKQLQLSPCKSCLPLP